MIRLRLCTQWSAILILLVSMFAFPGTAEASGFVVNTLDDLDDGHCNPAHCSLREAINAANDNPGPDTITFDVPEGGSNIIRVSSPLPYLTDDATTIDATTLPYYAGYPEIFIGKDVEIVATGLRIESNDNVIRGLGFSGFGTFPALPQNLDGAIVIKGSGNVIEANVIGLGASPNSFGIHLFGPGNIVRDNVISGNDRAGLTAFFPDNVIQGNIIGADAAGTTAVPNGDGIILLTGADHTLIGGAGEGEGNLVSGNQLVGIACYSNHNEFFGNVIGLDITGGAAMPNPNGGIVIYGSNNQIGGGAPGQGNVLSGNESGIRVENSFNDIQATFIQGNLIGTDITGSFSIPNVYGIEVVSENTLIGGVSPDLGNIIMGNERDGIFIYYSSEETFVARNTIAENGDAGIRLLWGPVENTFTQNSIYDNGDYGIITNGENNGIQPPVLSDGPFTTISGTACSNCLLEFFLAAPDPTGFGEGKTYLSLGYADSNGNFSVPVEGIGFCQLITATATDTTTWDTSGFSQNVYANCMQVEPLFLYPAWIFIIVVFGFLVWLIRRHRPNPGRAVLVGAAGGGLLFLVLILTLPFVRPEFTKPPECGNGIVESGETCDGDDLSLCLSGQVCENCRCTTVIEMPVCGDGDVDQGEQCDGDDLSLCRDDQVCENCRCVTYIELCGNGVLDEGEQCDGENLSYCRDDQVCENCRCVTPIEAEPPSEGCFYEALSSTYCRVSDYRESDPVAILTEGESALLVGLNPEYTHGLFELGSGDRCWMWFNTLDGPENPLGTCGVQMVNPPEPPEELVCRSGLDEAACVAAGGEYVAGVGCQCP